MCGALREHFIFLLGSLNQDFNCLWGILIVWDILRGYLIVCTALRGASTVWGNKGHFSCVREERRCYYCEENSRVVLLLCGG